MGILMQFSLKKKIEDYKKENRGNEDDYDDGDEDENKGYEMY
jgi:hypothetical protein